MNRRRITLTLGAAACGLLGAALGPAAFAFADDLSFDPASYTFDPVSPETMTGLYNITNSAPPGVSESIQGYQLFDVNDGSGPVGSFYAYESTAPYLTPHLDNANDALFSSEVLYVSPDAPGYQDPTGTAPTAGSVISTTGFGGGFENIYSAIPSGSTDTVTDTLKTPFGNIDLSNLVNSLGFDAAHVTPALPDHITSTDDPVITGVNGLPPLTIALQGYQPFEWDHNPADAFNAVETTTTDGFGFHTEALLVTQNTGTGDNTPPVGSVFNTIDFHNLSNVYSSMPSTTGGPDTVTDILTNTQTGQTIDLSSLFASSDASAGLTDGSNIQSFDFGDYTIQADPNYDEVFTGINGLPPGTASIQGEQVFDLMQGTDPTGTTFNADVITLPTMSFSNYAEGLLVTDSSDPALVPVGSVFDVTTYGSGFENIYSDLAGAGANGHDVIADTFVTPLGDLDLSWLYQGFDAAAGLNPTVTDPLVSFLDTAWLDLFHLF